MTATSLFLANDMKFELQDRKGKISPKTIKNWKMQIVGTYTTYSGTYKILGKGTLLKVELNCTAKITTDHSEENEP